MTMTDIEIRVLGVFIEKSLTQAGSYPLTLNSIVLGANQKQNREPVVSYTESEVSSALRLLERRESVSVYENRQALPRAFYVPQVEVVRDPGLLLDRLASRGHRPRRMALIEEPPADGFLGLGPRGTGNVEITASRGEDLVIRVLASQAGFLFVSDQYYPGWEATVDGSAAPIHRANHAFRAVRVPEGTSTVVFRYRPESLRIGAAVSGISLLALVVYAARRTLSELLRESRRDRLRDQLVAESVRMVVVR